MLEVFGQAGRLIVSGDPELLEIVMLSLQVTGTAVLFSCLIGFPLGAAIGALRFLGQRALSIFLSALMGLPPVLVGLTVYLMLSASGPLAPLQLLYTPAAMVIAQTILITPIVAALTREAVTQLAETYEELFRSIGVPPLMRIPTLLWDARTALVTVTLAGFGRAMAEVGAVIVVGGNIAHHTRVMTTSIALETSKGNLELALALGLVLLAIAVTVNALVMMLRTPLRGVDEVRLAS